MAVGQRWIEWRFFLCSLLDKNLEWGRLLICCLCRWLPMPVTPLPQGNAPHRNWRTKLLSSRRRNYPPIGQLLPGSLQGRRELMIREAATSLSAFAAALLCLLDQAA